MQFVHVSPKVRVIASALMCAVLLGCGGTSANRPGSNVTDQNVTLKVATISQDAQGKVTVDPKDLPLSMRARDRCHWFNNTNTDILIRFKDSQGKDYVATGQIIPAHQWSGVHEVCDDCPKQAYPYKVRVRDSHGVWMDAEMSGGPTDPQVTAGD